MLATLISGEAAFFIGVALVVLAAILYEYKQKERQAMHEAELKRKIIEQGDNAEAMLELMNREDTRLYRRKQQNLVFGLRMGGVMMMAIGASFVVAMAQMSLDNSFAMGMVPVAFGAVLLVFSWFVPGTRD